MKTNVEKVLERDQKLSELDDRADALQQGASQFEQQAGKLKRKFWLQNLKVNEWFYGFSASDQRAFARIYLQFRKEKYTLRELRRNSMKFLV